MTCSSTHVGTAMMPMKNPMVTTVSEVLIWPNSPMPLPVISEVVPCPRVCSTPPATMVVAANTSSPRHSHSIGTRMIFPVRTNPRRT